MIISYEIVKNDFIKKARLFSSKWQNWFRLEKYIFTYLLSHLSFYQLGKSSGIQTNFFNKRAVWKKICTSGISAIFILFIKIYFQDFYMIKNLFKIFLVSFLDRIMAIAVNYRF